MEFGYSRSEFQYFVLMIDIVDIKPVNMEELTEVITCAEFHPKSCNTFVYCSSKGTVRVHDMRTNALCDRPSKSI
jgi:serine/threonine-protein phosphatase 2A regulatory subunit B